MTPQGWVVCRHEPLSLLIQIHGEKERPEGVHPDTIIYSENLEIPAIMIQAGRRGHHP